MLKEVGKVRKCGFNLFAQALLHINTQVLTDRFDKMLEL